MHLSYSFLTGCISEEECVKVDNKDVLHAFKTLRHMVNRSETLIFMKAFLN